MTVQGQELKQYRIGVIGDAASLTPFHEMISQSPETSRAMAEVGIVAAALPDGKGEHFKALGHLPLYADYEVMLAEHPEINMLLETTGRAGVIERLRHDLPSGITLVERRAANFFVKLLANEQMWVACKVDLLHTQTLLKAIIDQLSEDILFLDTDGVVVDLNNNACKRLIKCKKELIGRRVEELFPNLESQCDTPGQCPVRKTIATQTATESIITEVDPEGRVHYFRVYVYPILGDNGALSNVVLIRRDITNRTRMEQRLQQTEKLASIGELSTYIAHEIRNPLFTISGFANSLLRGEGLDDKQREKLGIILEESKRLDTILKSILNFARPTEAKTSVVDVNQIVRSTMQVMGIGCGNQGIEVVMDLHADVAKAKADSEMIKQCLINLVKNAMESMPEGGTLTLRTGMTRDHVSVAVEDTGRGIPVDIRDKIFSPFFSTKGKGSGLGLAMTRKILDEIGGDVDVASKEGEGTQVTLLLPPVLAVAQSSATE